MKLEEININLLLCLHVLLKTGSTKKAASVMNITQPAFSKNLAKLRIIFQDDILVRTSGNKYKFTQKAIGIGIKLNSVIESIEDIYQIKEKFNPYICEKDFKLAMPDFVASNITPYLDEIIQETSPKSTYTIRSLLGYYMDDNSFRKDIDIVIRSADKAKKGYYKETLWKVKWACLASKENRRIKKEGISSENLHTYRMIDILHGLNFEGATINRFDSMKVLNMTSPYNFTSMQFVDTAFETIKKSKNTIMFGYEPFIKKAAEQYDLLIVPFENPPEGEYVMMWPQNLQNEPYHKWLRKVIKGTFLKAFPV